jgi:hypothetical protein
MTEAQVHKSNDNGNNQCCHKNQDSAVLKFAPCGPRDLVNEFSI